MGRLPKALQSEMAVSKKSPCVITELWTKLANFSQNTIFTWENIWHTKRG